MFQRRHYEFIADTIKTELGEEHTRRMVATMFADRFERTQPGFKPERFLKRCGVSA